MSKTSLSKLQIPILGLLLFACLSPLQGEDLDYFLPHKATFEATVPSPAAFLGFQPGDRHIQHHELLAYMRELARTSARVTIEDFGSSHDGRPLVQLIITSPENHSQLEALRQSHLKLTDPAQSADLDLDQAALVINLSYSIHGNEPSGSNAAPIVAYYLAAALDADLDAMLAHTIVVLDPSQNPDGLDRFAHWANRHRGKVANPDPAHREHQETWPSGRTNYYLFDLNRDWLALQQPESRGRVAQYHRWKPNILTDFHEMGSFSTYFFQPGVPQRTNPLTPPSVFQLTQRIATYHAKALDAIGSFYFTEEGYDDFYMGKGSTFPDLQGSIGILFEQASSRGHVQENASGEMSFAFTIRNQVRTSFSTLEAGDKLRLDLLRHQRDFYKESLAMARKSAVKGYIFAAPGDPARLFHFLDILEHHQIRVYKTKTDIVIEGRKFAAGQAYIAPTDQPQFRYLTTLFERRTDFEENIFYDISAWTLPLAFNLDYAEIKSGWNPAWLGEPMGHVAFPTAPAPAHTSALAYLLDWRGYYAPRALARLHAAAIQVKAAMRPFTIETDGQLREFGFGTLQVPVSTQPEKAEKIHALMQTIAAEDGVAVLPVDSGLTAVGIDLGSNNFRHLEKPKVLLVTGEGSSQSVAGEVWHLLDTRFGMPVTQVDTLRLDRVDLSNYTTIILGPGFYGTISPRATESLGDWADRGGTLIAIGSAVSWLASKNLVQVEFRNARAGDEARPQANEPESGNQQAAIEAQQKGKDEPPGTTEKEEDRLPANDRRARSQKGAKDGPAARARLIQADKDAKPSRQPYADARDNEALADVAGSIFLADIDITHPLGYGYSDSSLPIFRDHTLVAAIAKNPYATPVAYTEEPLLAGYCSAENLAAIRSSASVLIHKRRAGRAVLMLDNPNFRAFWFGTNRLFLNAVFFGSLIDVP